MDTKEYSNFLNSTANVQIPCVLFDNVTDGTGNCSVPNVTMVTHSNVGDNATPVLKYIFDVVSISTSLIIMLGMGATIDIIKLLQHLRRPFGAGIGMLAQFVVLPLATYGLAHALWLGPEAAIGMLLVSSCPGGTISNIFAYWADGDVQLSLTMTTLSTVLAIGMMPLNIWIYSRSWTNEDLIIPFLNILISLVCIVTPATIGILLRWKRENVAIRVVKVGSVCGGGGVVTILVLMSVLFPFMYMSPWSIYVAAALLPIAGFTFGYVIAKVFRMNGTHARTIALETGIQNFPLCMAVISLSFPRELIPKLVLFPLLYGVFIIAHSCLFVLGYHVLKKVKVTRDDKRNDVTFKGLAQKDVGQVVGADSEVQPTLRNTLTP